MNKPYLFGHSTADMLVHLLNFTYWKLPEHHEMGKRDKEDPELLLRSQMSADCEHAYTVGNICLFYDLL